VGAIIGLIIFGIPAAIIANSKGFGPIRWLFACGLIGLIVVLCLSSSKASDISDEERQLRAAKGNKIGGIMCGICVGLSILSVLVALAMMA